MIPATLRRSSTAALLLALVPVVNPSAIATASPATTSAVRSTSTSVAAPAGIAHSFAVLQKKLGGRIGIAWVPLGRGGSATVLGSLRTDVAWSTSKVPVTVAAVRADHGHLTRRDAAAAKAAITRSDNAAAMRLWARLGSGKRAAAATQRVLRDAGDRHTVVQSRQTRAGFTPFGQTRWALDDQARFAAGLSCVSGSRPVLALMGRVISSERWGAGRLPGDPPIKGGWGPYRSGRYLVRQLAIVRLPDGRRVGLAIAAAPADGTFAGGVRDLDAIARWARQHVRVSHETGCH